jgi:hypothetical protein
MRLVVTAVGEHRLRAGALDRGELRERHALRQDHRRGRANELRGERDALAVVAGGRGHHAGRAAGRVEACEGVERAADLEGAGALEVLELEEHLTTREL